MAGLFIVIGWDMSALLPGNVCVLCVGCQDEPFGYPDHECLGLSFSSCTVLCR